MQNFFSVLREWPRRLGAMRDTLTRLRSCPAGGPAIMDSTIKLNVNGREIDVASDPQRVLLDVLREELHLTGTKYGCGEGSCGACTVLVNGKATFSCSTPVTEVLDAKIETVESLAHGDTLH